VTPDRTEVLWDRWGVPHVYARSEREAYYGLGFAMARAHSTLLLRWYARARGCLAAVDGAEAIATDELTHRLSIPAIAASWLRRQTPRMDGVLAAFTAGINNALQERADGLPANLRQLLPVTPTDPLAIAAWDLADFLLVEWARPSRAHVASTSGSNAWALAPSRTASGHALLLSNPHLEWSAPFYFFEAHLVTEEGWVYGAVPLGLPAICMGFNDRVAWTHTRNTINGCDVFAIEPAGGGYRLDGRSVPFDESTIEIDVAGARRRHAVRMRSTIHGPVLGEDPEGKPLAVRLTGSECAGALEQWLDMGAAGSVQEIEQVARQLQFPMFTLMAADSDGHIAHVFNGLVRRRPDLEGVEWGSTLPGDRSDVIVDRYLTYDELPRVADPASGWVQNANDPPWTTTFPRAIDHDAFPEWVAPPPHMLPRALASARLLLENDRISLDRLIELKYSTRSEAAERIAADVVAAARESGNEICAEAADVLAGWDCHMEPDARGAVLFAAWWEAYTAELGQEARWAVSFDIAAGPLSTPSGIGNPAAALRLLAVVARDVRERYGALDVEWGSVFRVRRGAQDLPAFGAANELGTFLLSHPFAAGADGTRATEGETWICAVELATPVQARVLMTYGNSSEEDSGHTDDQLPLFGARRLREARLKPHDVEQELERRDQL
jgi:acyl-homoserine-lactone acylase